MTRLVAQVTERLGLKLDLGRGKEHIDRAVELSDRFGSIKPKDHVVPYFQRVDQKPPKP